MSTYGSADVVQSPPKDCPPGSRGVTSHAGPACVVANCESDAECKAAPSTQPARDSKRPRQGVGRLRIIKEPWPSE